MDEVLASLFESVVFVVFLILFLEPKRSRKQLCCGSLIAIGMLFSNILVCDWLGVYYIYVFMDLVIMMIFWRIFLKGTLIKFLLGFSLFYFGAYFSTYLPSFILSFIEPGIILAIQSIGTVYRVGYLIAAKILLLLYMLIIVHFRGKFSHNKWSIPTLFYSVFPILVILFFVLLTSTLTELYRTKPTLGVKMIGIMAGVHFIVIVAIYLSIQAVRKAEEEYSAKRLSYMLDLQRKSLGKFINQERELYRLRHELEHKLFTVQYLLEKDKADEGLYIMKQTIKELCGNARDISVSQNIVDTMAVDIESKYEMDGIRIEKDISFADDTMVDLIDLCMLFGNLMDNAMEAARKSVDKQVRVSVREEFDCLLIRVSNTYSKESSDVKKFSSYKEECVKHGFGMQNIQEIVSRYGGELLTSDEGDWFYVNVIIYGQK